VLALNLITALGRLDNRRAVALIAGTSLLVKLACVIFVGGGLDSFPAEGSDNAFYYQTSVNWLETGVYGYERGVPTVGMPPGQPAFLALLYVAGGRSIGFAKLAQIMVLTAVAVLAFATANACFGKAIGLCAGLLLAVDPAQAYLSSTFLSEPLFIFLMVLGIYLLVRQCVRPRAVWLVGAGLCFGLAGLTRNQGWLFAIFLLFGSVVSLGQTIRVRDALTVLVVAAAVIAPWTYRNFLVTGAFVPVSVEGGLTLWSGNNPDFEWRQPMPMSLPVYAVPQNLSGEEVDRYYRQRAVAWILANPDGFVVNGFRKVVTLYNFDPMSARADVADRYRLVGLFPYGLLLPFILLGLLKHLTDPDVSVILCYILFTTLVSFVFFGDSRIRAPIQPYLYLFGVLGAQQCAQWWTARRQQTLLTRHRTARGEG
jgi:4-amino-4-deoxy-L-arabinose transferase-like glycosyltransferase